MTKKNILRFKIDYYDDLFRLVDSAGKIQLSSHDFDFVYDFAKNLMRHGHIIDLDKTVTSLSANKIWGC